MTPEQEGILRINWRYVMKLTIVDTGCAQVGMDTWADYHKTQVIQLTEEQKELIKPPKGMNISSVIFEQELDT